MKKTAILLILFMVFGLRHVKAHESIEVTQADKEVVAQQLETEAKSDKHDSKTKEFLNKIAGVFKGSKDTNEIDVDAKREDCVDCSKKAKAKSFFSKIGKKLGKGAAWLSTTTAKPFMTASAFIKGAVEKGDKNKELVALYQFFLNHEAEFDDLYLEAGTPEEMIELMLARMEEIMEKKTHVIMKDFLLHLGITREIPADMKDFELTAEEIASIDESKIDPDFINRHPEYKEVKGIIGEMTKQDIMDIVESGYFEKAISFEDYKSAAPSIPELVGTVVGQIFVPKIALGIVSKTLAGLYMLPVLAADVGTGVSTAICLKKENQEKFESDKDLKQFCSYVVNRTGYQLMKGRAKGYVAGKKFHNKIAAKIKSIKEKRAEKKKKKQLEKEEKEKANLIPELQ